MKKISRLKCFSIGCIAGTFHLENKDSSHHLRHMDNHPRRSPETIIIDHQNRAVVEILCTMEKEPLIDGLASRLPFRVTIRFLLLAPTATTKTYPGM
jgi:hypothetical protein